MNERRSDEPRSPVVNQGVIDLVTHDPKTDEYALIMVESRTWDGGRTQLEQLQAKANNYLEFVISGEFVRKYPQAAGKPIRFQLDCPAPPSGETTDFLQRLEAALRKHGIRFVVNVL